MFCAIPIADRIHNEGRLQGAFEMSQSREKIITVRVNNELYEEVKKKAETAKLPMSEYVCKLIESSLADIERTDLLLKNIHEEVLQLEDMITLMQGFNVEVFTTLLARTSTSLNPDQKRQLLEQRVKAEEGLKGYMKKVADKTLQGESPW